MKKKNTYERFFSDYWKIIRKTYPKCVRSGLVIGWIDGMFFIPHNQLTRRWQPNRQGQFDSYMAGQTMFDSGCYACDVERFLGGYPVID